MQTRVALPILDDTGMRVVGTEDLSVDLLPRRHVRVLRTPAYVAGLARGDRIRLDSGTLRGFHMVEPAGMLGVAVVFASVALRRRAKRVVAQAVTEVDAVLEGERGRLLILSVPKVVGLPRIRWFLNGLCVLVRGAQWYFLNPDGPHLPTAVAARVGLRRA